MRLQKSSIDSFSLSREQLRSILAEISEQATESLRRKEAEEIARQKNQHGEDGQDDQEITEC